MQLKIIIGTISLCVILFILQYFSSTIAVGAKALTMICYPSIVSKRYNSADDINLGFSNFELEQAKLRENQLKDQYDITAILLNWKRFEYMKKTLKELIHANLFKEILIWNNNPEITVTMDKLLINDYPSKNIRIINSKENLKDEAKYRACAQVTTRACFYADDDWEISHYMQSLVASFRSDPNILHAMTDSYTYYTNLVWSYFDSTIDLHTAFSWIGCGSVFLREYAQRHLRFLHEFLKNDIDLIPMSDVFFSIWLNDIPSQMNTMTINRPTQVDDRHISLSHASTFPERLYRSSVAAIRILEDSLRFNQSNTNNLTFSRQENSRFPYYVKSPSFTDDLIFYSNILPFDLQNVTFNISRDFERGTRLNLPNGTRVNNFTQRGTLHAVDGNMTTYWHSTKSIRSDDFYAIDFLHIKTNITFILSVIHRPDLQRNLDVSISFDGLWWSSYRSLKGIYTKMETNLQQQQQVYTMLFRSDEFTLGFQSFRYIKFKALHNSDDHFKVCELAIITKNTTTNILHGFESLNMES